MNMKNLGGWGILTILLLYYVLFTLSEGYSIAWYGWIGTALYCYATWLLLSQQEPPVNKRA